MKYIRTYETEEKFLTDKDSTSRGFRLKPTLYKYSDVDNGIYLELDDPRKHGDSTYMEITLDSDVEFSFYIGNKSGDTQTTMNCSIDWGDGTVETKTITKDTHGFKLSHNYKAGSYKIELYGVERSYVISGDEESGMSLISPIGSIERVVLSSSFIIGHDTFGGCTSLTSVYISEGATIIGDYAFNGCTSLTSIYIPNTVNIIGDGIFDSCTSLTSIYIPNNANGIGAQVFRGCSSLKSINIPESVTSIESGAFANCTSLSSIYIPESVTSIGDWPFSHCTSLSSIYIPESVTSIGWSAFQSCSSLTSVYIPESVTSIGHSVFGDCSSLKSINIPENVTSIEDYVFSNCSSLKSINIPEKVTSIGAQVFRGCSSLKSISSLNNTAPTLGRDPFTNIPANGTLHIKPGATGYDAWLSQLPSGWTIVEDL